MGLIAAFNAVLECMVTGATAALFLLWFAKMGWFPSIMIVIDKDELEEREEG
ncbi:hypothetical protein D3C87_2086450 [compost metagenome]